MDGIHCLERGEAPSLPDECDIVHAADADQNLTTGTRTFVLVHGSWTDSRCWHKVTPLLTAAGHRAVAVDMPGRRNNPMAAKEVTLQACVDTVLRVIDRQPGKVVLVGHSRAGVVLSQVAEERPDAIERLIYVAAFLLSDGETIPDWAARDTKSLVAPHLIVDAAGGWDRLEESALREALYADCSEADFAASLDRFVPEPTAPFMTPLRLTSARYGRVRRSYIELGEDRAVTPALQAAMRRKQPCDQVIRIEAGHAAHLSSPRALASAILLLG